MKPQTLTSFTSEPSIWGSQIFIRWELPATLPENYKIYVFKRSKTNVTDQEIADYFENQDDLSNYRYNGLYVWDKIDGEKYTSINDTEVLNEITYYYRALIRDEDAKENSDILSLNEVAYLGIAVDKFDLKDAVCKAIEKMFDSLKTNIPDKVTLNKDIKIVKAYPLPEALTMDTIVVDRINGAQNTSFLGDGLNSSNEMSSIETEVIRVTFLSTEANNRRDKVYSIFRSYKILLQKLIMAAGVNKEKNENKILNLKVTLEGDYQDIRFSPIALGTTLVVTAQTQLDTFLPIQQINEIVSEFTIN